MTGQRTKWLCLLLAAALGMVPPAGAQHGGGPPGGGGGGQGPGGPGAGSGPGAMGGGPGGGMPGGMSPSAGARGAGIPKSTSATAGSMRTGMGAAQFGPVGRWWDDKGVARSINLRPEQKQRMDAVFNSNRSELLQRYQELKQQERKLEEATRETRVSGGSVFAQINRVAQAREALGATNERMTDALRKELDAEQVEKLQAIK